MSRKRIYLDYASTTPLDPRALKAMLPYFREKFGNPSSIHSEGVAAKKALDAARKTVARILQARPDEIIFTSGGTEANNLAIFGAVKVLEEKAVPISKMRFITTVIEHSSVLECFRELERRGAKVDYVPVKDNGIVNPKTIGALLRPETVLVSVGYANNEIGTIQPIREISRIIRAHNFKFRRSDSVSEVGIPTEASGLFKLSNFQTCFHSDGSQAPLYLDCNPTRLGVDLLTFDGHKMYGPKGVGVLYAKRGTLLAAVLVGGGQERGLRSTTENLPGIIGFARAFEIAVEMREKESARLQKLQDYFYSSVLDLPEHTEYARAGRVENIRIKKRFIINGSLTNRLPNNINISLHGINTEMLVLKLDAAGIACSTKSSCLRDESGSYVVRALGGGESRALSTLRFTFGRETTKKHIDALLKRLTRIVSESV